MKAVHHSIRLPAALDTALRKMAEQHGVMPYAMLQRCVKAGLSAEMNAAPDHHENRELVAELASVSIRLADVERLLDRTLFTACAAYCYARSAALADDKSDEIIIAEMARAYDRQKAIAEDRP